MSVERIQIKDDDIEPLVTSANRLGYTEAISDVCTILAEESKDVTKVSANTLLLRILERVKDLKR